MGGSRLPHRNLALGAHLAGCGTAVPAWSNFDGIRKQVIAPFVDRPLEIGLGMDTMPFAGKPFPTVGFERKMLDVVVAGLLPMFDRQRLAIVLAVEISA